MSICEHCGDSYEHLGTHWRYNETHRPEISSELHQIITGLLMGDGSLDMSQENSFVKTNMTNEEYLKYLDSEFGNLSRGVYIHKQYDNPNHNTAYGWSTRSHPEFNEYKDWYNSGVKVWPDDISLNPTILKHWYCGDGHREKVNGNWISIEVSKEHKNVEKIKEYFRAENLPTPKVYNGTTAQGNIQCKLYFSQSDSKEIWEYMGEPLPGFEYKWPR